MRSFKNRIGARGAAVFMSPTGPVGSLRYGGWSSAQPGWAPPRLTVVVLCSPSRRLLSTSTECCSARRRSSPRWSPPCRTAGGLSRSACAPAESPAPDCSGLWVGFTLLLHLNLSPLWPEPLGPPLSPVVCAPQSHFRPPGFASIDLLLL